MHRPVPYGKQWITEEDIRAVNEVLLSDFLTQGPKIREFEEAFAHYVGAQYAVAVSNGTAALHLAALALRIDEKTNVITTPITFAASANCVWFCGGNVFFADIHPQTFLIDLNKVRELIESKPKGFFKGLIVVDFSGMPVNLEEFRKLADENNLWIIEDACHAPGGYFVDSDGKKQFCGNGNFADLAVFSFHPVKHITTGEGGMITTNRKDLYEKLLLLRTHGITKDPSVMAENHGGWYYEMHTLGYNYRLTDIQAALGISQLKRADEGLEKRRRIALKYNQELNPLSDYLTLPLWFEGHAYHLYVIRVKNNLRPKLYNYLKEKNIFSQVHYIPLHFMPYYKKTLKELYPLPESEKYYRECLSIPIFPSLSEEDQDYVIDTIKSFFSSKC
ncbi:MAG: UDP-4-amino-4,6-dideoxy-N-acetyl-beta-L-altrosamine transaminase [Bacteroidia bacterium]|nr:UDP-4-amino-4,6-dideoxy-N-acetyl-beta-L-altrosamine transaminase [Bacteroidia bacterium]